MSNEPQDLPDFSGKILSITIMDDDVSYDLTDPHFEVQGGRLFIIGIVPKGATGSNWSAGATSAVAWERITDYYVFNSLDAYQRATEVSANYQKSDDDK